MNVRKVRIGCGAAYEMDRIEPPVLLAEKGNIDYLCFETLAERTLGFAQLRRMAEPEKGYNPLTEARLRAVLPACVKNHIKIIANFGAANPLGAADMAMKVIRDMGLGGLSLATVLGDDVRHLLTPDLEIWETGESLAKLDGEVVSANAYIGADPIAVALREGADIVITGRAADPSLFLAPLIYEFGWKEDDWNLLGAGTVVGHLLECSVQVTGGMYLDPGYTEDVPDIAHLGFPIAEVYEDGEAIITKVPGTGGIVTTNTCKAQLLYEIHDPASYLTPDVAADFRYVHFDQIGDDQVKVSGGRGKERPKDLKVMIGVMQGYIGEGQISWAGPGCYEKARVAAEAVKTNLQPVMSDIEELRVDFIGVDSIFGSVSPELQMEPNEVRLRVAGRAKTEQVAERIGQEVEYHLFGPIGAGGIAKSVRPCLAMYSTLIPRENILTEVTVHRIDIWR